MSLRAVLFDLGGTLWRSLSEPDIPAIDRASGEQVRPLLARLGGSAVEPAGFVRAFWTEVDAVYAARSTPALPDYRAILRSLLAARGIAVAPRDADRIFRAVRVSSRLFGMEPFPDTLPTIGELRRRGYRTAIVSNQDVGGDQLRSDLPGYGMDGLFDAVVTSGDVGFDKPHPAPFRLALDLLGVAADEALMVGDSAEKDVAGARAAGLRCVLKVSDRAAARADADADIGALGELLELPLLGPPA
jgi:putative hydrolase of the HAD superfamily